MRSSRRFFAPTLGLLFVAASAPAHAQQANRVEITSRRTNADSSDRRLGNMKRQLDSLTRIYNEDDDLNVTERRKLVQAINALVERFAVESSRPTAEGGRGEIHFRVTTPEGGARAGAMTRGMAELQRARNMMAQPTGWLGFVAFGPSLQTRTEEGEQIVRFMSYPRIMSVEPSSPAQNAGIFTGDTLIAYDGRDVRENDISMTKLLRPSTKVTVRVRRDGKVRDIPLTVGTAPQRILIRRDDEASGAREAWTVIGVPDAPSFPRSAAAPLPPAASGGAGAMRAPSAPANGPLQPNAIYLRGTPMAGAMMLANGVAGAQVANIVRGGGFSRMTGLESGVMITTAPTGSPANESGLTDGDAIIRAGMNPVRDVTELRDAVRRAAENGEHALELEIIRDRKSQTLTLKW